MSRSRIFYPALDGLRGFAFLLVFFHHLLDWSTAGLSSVRAHPLFLGISDAGRFGVPLFFILSSFLVTRLLIEEERRNERIDIKAFLIRRTLRLWPLYFLFVGWYILRYVPYKLNPGTWISPTNSEAITALHYLVFMGDVRHMVEPSSPVSHLWSIGVEEKFYLVWPFVLSALSVRRLPHVCYGLIAFAWLYRLLLAGQVPWTYLWFGPLGHVDCFAYGALIALGASGRLPRLGSPPRLNPQTVLAVFLGSLVLIGSIEFTFYGSLDARGLLFAVIHGFVNLASAAFLILIRDATSGWANSKPMMSLGKLSYGAYLLHVPVGAWFVERLIGHGPLGRALAVGATLMATIALAWLSFRFIETPFLNLKRRFVKVESHPPETGGAASSVS